MMLIRVFTGRDCNLVGAVVPLAASYEYMIKRRFHIISAEITLRSVRSLTALVDRLSVGRENGSEQVIKIHYENTPIQINRKFHLQKLKISR